MSQQIVLLVPSRGRPERASEMTTSAVVTATHVGGLSYRVIVDPDEPYLDEYRRLFPTTLVELMERLGFTGSLNAYARACGFFEPDWLIGAFGDDVLFRTPGWDETVRATLATPGLAYGDDLIHGQNHPTAVFMSAVIAEALDWVALPATRHQWADDGWKRLGEELGLLRFMPGVILEHMHPAVGKAEMDPTYESIFGNDCGVQPTADYEGFMAWVANGGLAADVARVREALA